MPTTKCGRSDGLAVILSRVPAERATKDPAEIDQILRFAQDDDVIALVGCQSHWRPHARTRAAGSDSRRESPRACSAGSTREGAPRATLEETDLDHPTRWPSV